MEKSVIQPVIVRVDVQKYRAIRHELLDSGETFNGLVNKLLDEHIGRARKTDSHRGINSIEG